MSKKTKSMLFATQQKLGRSNERLQIYIKNDLLENVDCFKYLGIWLDPSLTWSANTDKLVSKVNKRVGLLRRVRNVLPQRTLNLLYKSLIVPHFDYCDVLWGNACKTFLSKLDRLQNAAGKIILGLPRRYPTELLLNTLGWQKLHDRRSNHLNVMVYKSLTCKLPTNLCNIFNHVHETHSHLTRACSQGNLVPPRCKNNSDKRKFTYRWSISFNDLPTTAKRPLPSSIGAFKHILSQ